MVRFRDALVDSIHAASHDIEDDDHEISIWYSSVELAEIEEENDFLVDNKSMLQQSRPNICWRGLEEKAKRIQFIQIILEEQEKQKNDDANNNNNKVLDWEVLRSACEKESREAREKAQNLGHKDRIEALSVHQEEPEQSQ